MIPVGSFNEAAGIPRGRPFPEGRPADCWNCFNEAAGIPRGRRAGWGVHDDKPDAASMRPRVFPAEDVADQVKPLQEQLTLQ